MSAKKKASQQIIRQPSPRNNEQQTNKASMQNASNNTQDKQKIK